MKQSLELFLKAASLTVGNKNGVFGYFDLAALRSHTLTLTFLVCIGCI
jgi:hypothetical protein